MRSLLHKQGLDGLPLIRLNEKEYLIGLKHVYVRYDLLLDQFFVKLHISGSADAEQDLLDWLNENAVNEIRRIKRQMRTKNETLSEIVKG